MYIHLAKYPERAKRFAKAMDMYSTGKGYELSYVVNGYPWVNVQDTVVDVGGSYRDASRAIARDFPSFKFVVQDLSETVTASLKTVSSNFAFRVRLMAHDLFTEQPVKSADVYFSGGFP